MPIVFSDEFDKDIPRVRTVRKVPNRDGIELDVSLLGKKRERRACAPDRCKLFDLILRKFYDLMAKFCNF